MPKKSEASKSETTGPAMHISEPMTAQQIAEYEDRKAADQRRKKQNREHCGACIKQVLGQLKVKVAPYEIEVGKDKRMVDTIAVPPQLELGKNPTKADRETMERFVKQYLIAEKKCARGEAIEQAGQAFGYSYRID